MPRYVFKTVGSDGLPIKNAKLADPQKIGDSIAAMRAEGRTPKAMLDVARAEDHPLHPHLEWDDAKAAEAHRLEQLRTICQLLRTDDVVGEEPKQAFLSVSTGTGGISYHTLAEVSRSRDLQLAVLRAAERDLESWERRYRELVDICKTVQVARKAVSARRQKLQEDRAQA